MGTSAGLAVDVAGEDTAMEERRRTPRTRSLRAGKVLLNDRRSVIDCVVRNLSQGGACVQVASIVGIPAVFELLIDGERESRACTTVWQAHNRIGVAFRAREAPPEPERDAGAKPNSAAEHAPAEPAVARDLVRPELLALRAALNEVPFGVVLLDAELRAQYINRAFRRMWRLTDEKADSKPAFISLMYHGRATGAYEVPAGALDAYVHERVALVKVGDPVPLDIRLTSGEVLRFQCAVLPSGGRMLSYTYVTDIVRRSDELERLTTALDSIADGVTLLDVDLKVEFMNAAARRLWKLGDAHVDRKPHYVELVSTAPSTKVYGVPPDELDSYMAHRIAVARTGDPRPYDVQMGDGRTIRAQCAVLPGDGRMLTYTDVTDLVKNADQVHRLATTDLATGQFNRRQFMALAEAEWSRFQRYHRPLSLTILDVDLVKFINDNLGQDVGDEAIAHVAALAAECKRASDVLARIGGDEFALLLPETDIEQAKAVAERCRQKIVQSPLRHETTAMTVTASMGVAQATLSMSGADALIKLAEQALADAKRRGRNQIFAAASGARPNEAAAE
jgi:diguanylate cyclase (GGDEF)-like protein